MISLIQIIVFSIVAFLISLLLFPVIIKIFRQLKWFDTPGTHKIHSDFVPSMGGVSILVGMILALLMSLPLHQWIVMKYFFISVALMFLIGLRDDVLALSPRQKLFSQFLPVFVLVFLDNVTLESLYGLIDVGEFPTLLTYFISLFTVIIITNAYNLIDGIDGLAGSIGFITLLFFGGWFYLAGLPYMSLLALTLTGSLAAFLLFNWQPSSIFMGDTGALTVGLVLSYFSVSFINHNYQLPEAHPVKFTATVSTGLCVMIIPVFDTLRVIVLRLRKSQSPFHADRNHLHHRLLARGLSHADAVKWLAGINVSFILLAILLKSQPDYVVLPVVILLCLLMSFGFKQQPISNSSANA
jgi:UDP-GlcNAc:undecaprenyl-phosphate GlcNAc-1-phosphate transferase